MPHTFDSGYGAIAEMEIGVKDLEQTTT